jgi:hypothetical protein
MRKAFRRKIWGLSLAGGLAVGTVLLLAGFAQQFVSVYQELGEKNQLTLAKIPCREPLSTPLDNPTGEKKCDISGVENDWGFSPADYVLNRRTGYFIYNSQHWPSFWLNFSDVTFIRRFRKPQSVSFETGERWRLYSESAEVDGETVEVMVAAFEYAPWMLGKNSGSPEIDEQLKSEAQKIVYQLKRGPINTRADSWQVVDAATTRVRSWSGDVPAFYPKTLNVVPMAFHFEDSRVWLVRSASNENLQAVSLGSVGSVYTFVLFGLGAFVLGLLVTYPIAKRFGRTGITHPAPLDEALRTGESGFVEFKQEIKERQSLCKDVTAFANSNGGTVFIGLVDGSLEILGIDGATPEKKDMFERGLRDSIRHTIQPSPDVDIDFPSKDGRVVARIFVRASPQRHSFEGRYYVREGSQSRYLVNGEIGDL